MPKRLSRREFIVFIHRIGAISFEPCHLKMHETRADAPPSPIKFNFRSVEEGGPLRPEHYPFFAQQYLDYIESRSLLFDCLAGIPDAGDPLALSLHVSIQATCPPLLPSLLFLEKVIDGTRRSIGKIIGGRFRSGDRVALVDDVISHGDSKLEAARKSIEGERSEKLAVAFFLVMIDREQGGREVLAQAGYVLEACFTMTEVLDVLVEESLISPEVRTEVIEYTRSCQAQLGQ